VYAVELFHQFTWNLGAGVTVPFYEQEVENRATGTTTRASGIGDVAAYLVWSPWCDGTSPKEFLHPAGVAFAAGLSLPTGDELEGELPGLHSYHLGSGSLEFKFSARYQGWLSESFSLFAGTSTIIDEGANSIGFRYGTSAEFFVGASYAHEEVAAAYVTFDAVHRDHDRIGPLELQDSGGTWWFVEIGVSVTPASGWMIEASVSIPVYSNVHGTQPVADLAAAIGLRYRF
jgi:hypothetical protein